MSDQGVDVSKRQFLSASVTVVGAVGTGFAAVPFISAMSPSAKARAAGAPIEIDIGKLEPGQRIVVKWRGKPVWILNRGAAALQSLLTSEPHLRDPESNESKQPESSRNRHRSIKPEIFVALGICTHLGCSPTFRPEIAPKDLGNDWQGGFFCPCHGSSFDYAGRVFQGVPAPTNLEIPPYLYMSDTRILVGKNKEETA